MFRVDYTILDYSNPVLFPGPAWEHRFSGSAQLAHHHWNQRGRRGPGRVSLEDEDLRGARTSGGDMKAARFVRCNLDESNMQLEVFTDAILIGCSLSAANLINSTFERAPPSARASPAGRQALVTRGPRT